MKDAIVDRSQAQKRLRIEIMKLEAKPLGYSIVKTDHLKEMLAKLSLVDRLKTMLVD